MQQTLGQTGNRTFRPKQAENLEISPVIDGFVVSLPGNDKIHYLNPTAAFILEASDGRSTAAEIAKLLAEVFGLHDEPYDDVDHCLQILCSEGLTVCL